MSLDRTAKYNQLLRIEQELGEKAVFDPILRNNKSKKKPTK